MMNLVLFFAIVAALAGVATWINTRHERAAAADGPSADDRLDLAWDGFSAFGSPEEHATAVDALLRDIAVERLQRKHSLARLAVMAIHAKRHDVLPDVATRAAEVAGGCGESQAIAVLAEAYTGSVERARAMYMATQGAVAGCASCGADTSVRILMQELAMALDGDAQPAPRADVVVAETGA